MNGPYLIRTLASALLAVLFGCVIGGLRAASAADSHPQLSGSWTLDRHDSDDISKKLKQDGHHWFGGLFRSNGAATDQDADGDTPSVDDEGPQSGGGDDGGEADEGRLGPAQSLIGVPRLQRELFKSDSMRIDQRGGVYRITYADGMVRVIRENGPGRTTSASGNIREGAFGYSIPYWDKQTLVLETDTDSGKQTLEKYTLQKNGSRLLLEIVLQVPHRTQPLVLKRVFERGSP